MDIGFLAKTYYGNTVGEWLLAALVIIAALIVGRIVYWLFSTVARRLTAKTDTKADDILIDQIEEPIVFAVTVAGIWIGLKMLTFSEEMTDWIDKGVQFLIVLAFTWLIARLLEAVFSHVLVPVAEESETDLDDQLLPIVRKGTKVAVWGIGIIVALNNAGYNVGALIAGLGIGGLALAMAAQETVKNMFGGFTIFTDKPFTINDRIKISGFDGNIEEVGIRSTRLRTFDGTLVTIPNSVFSDSTVENVSAEPARRVVLTLGLTYDTTADQMRRAMEILNELIDNHDDLDDKRLIFFSGFGDFSLNITFIYFITKGADIFATQTDVHLKVLERFNAEGLEFAFPTQTLYTIQQEPAQQ